MIGQTISQYKILEKLGEGGMGVVYKAEDTKLDRMVALKFLPSHLASSAQDKARFTQEAKAAAALNHPNVCSIIDIQEHDNQMFIVMELVDGQTLRERMASLSLKQAMDVGVQIADGLAAAHEKGIVHRDIKPENIMIRKDGIAQIMDFGLAKLRASGSKITRLTKEGSTVGTAGYMSPEQVQGRDTDHRSDIFSYGVVLYELFTGVLPFRGVHETALMYEIVNVDPPPLSALKADIDPEVERIVLDCLEKDANERSQSAKQISIDLKQARRESSRQRASRITSALPIGQAAPATKAVSLQSPGWKRHLWPGVSGVFALGMVLLSWLLLQRSPFPHPVVRLGFSVPPDQSIATGGVPALAISPDGSEIVYKPQGVGKLYHRTLESFKAEPIEGTDHAIGPFFSPDGRWLAFFADGKLMKVPFGGGVPVTLAPATDNRGGTWIPDGSIVYTPYGIGGLYRISANGGDPQVLTTPDSTKNERTHRWPTCMPDGKTILFTVGVKGSPDYYESATIDAVNLTTRERKTVIKGASTACSVEPGKLFYLHSGVLFAIAIDTKTLETGGTPFPMVDNITGDPTTGAGDYSISQNGTLAYVSGTSSSLERQLVLISKTGIITPLPIPEQTFMEPHISPNGKQIAVVIGKEKDYDVWLYDMERHTLSRFTFGGVNHTPVWSPDGTRIAYASDTGGVSTQIVIRNADGSGMPRYIPGYTRCYINAWSPDGSRLILLRYMPKTLSDVVTIPVNATDARSQTTVIAGSEFAEAAGSVSPDGKWIAYSSNETATGQVYVRPFPEGTGKWQISTDGGYEPHWSREGKTLFFGSNEGLMSVAIDGSHLLVAGTPQLVIKNFPRLRLESNSTYDVTPDGASFLCIKPKNGEDVLHDVSVVLNWFDDVRLKMAPEK